MTKNNFLDESIAQLVDGYRRAAIEHGDAINAGNHRSANRAADRIACIYSTIRRSGISAQHQLIALLEDPVPRVRGWAAAHSLEFSPLEGERVLKILAEQRGLLGMSAQATLEEWRAGRLRFP